MWVVKIYVSGVDCIDFSCNIVACDGDIFYVLKKSKQDPKPFDRSLFSIHTTALRATMKTAVS